MLRFEQFTRAFPRACCSSVNEEIDWSCWRDWTKPRRMDGCDRPGVWTNGSMMQSPMDVGIAERFPICTRSQNMQKNADGRLTRRVVSWPGEHTARRAGRQAGRPTSGLHCGRASGGRTDERAAKQPDGWTCKSESRWAERVLAGRVHSNVDERAGVLTAAIGWADVLAS